MGLDQYLSKKIYVGANYEFREVKCEIHITSGENEIKVNPKRVSLIEEQVGYWRKANHIHKWFVDNVQGGNDDCREYYVSVDKLDELLTICKAIKNDPTQAIELLPRKQGFFFGSEDYDEDYFEDVEMTIELLEGILKEEKEGANGDYYYTSSW